MGQSTAKALGFIPEVCRQKAYDARLELLDYYGLVQIKFLKSIRTYTFLFLDFEICLNHHLRWAKNHGPKDHPAVIKLLATAGI